MPPLYLRLVGIGLVGVGTLSASSAAWAQANAKPAFLPAEASEKAGDGVPVDPILAAKLEANSAALANAHNPEEIVRCSLQQVEVLSQVGTDLSLEGTGRRLSPDRRLPVQRRRLRPKARSACWRSNRRSSRQCRAASWRPM